MSLATELANLLLAKGMHANDLPFLSEDGWRLAMAAVRPPTAGWAAVPGPIVRHRVAELMK